MKTLRTIALAALFTVSSTAALFACKGGGCRDDDKFDALGCISIVDLTRLLTKTAGMPTVSEVDLFIDGLGRPNKSCDIKDAVMVSYTQTFDLKGVAASLKSLRLEFGQFKLADGFLKELSEIRTLAAAKRDFVADPILDKKIDILNAFIKGYQAKEAKVVGLASAAFATSALSYVQAGYDSCDSYGPCGQMVYVKPKSSCHEHKAKKCGC